MQRRQRSTRPRCRKRHPRIKPEQLLQRQQSDIWYCHSGSESDCPVEAATTLIEARGVASASLPPSVFLTRRPLDYGRIGRKAHQPPDSLFQWSLEDLTGQYAMLDASSRGFTGVPWQCVGDNTRLKQQTVMGQSSQSVDALCSLGKADQVVIQPGMILARHFEDHTDRWRWSFHAIAPRPGVVGAALKAKFAPAS